MPSFALFDLYEKPVAICRSFGFSQLLSDLFPPFLLQC